MYPKRGILYIYYCRVYIFGYLFLVQCKYWTLLYDGSGEKKEQNCVKAR